MNDYISRFRGIAALYGTKALFKLKDAHVVVVGIGGVGSWACEALVRSGVGEITIIDSDSVNITNTNRQILALSSTLNQSKVSVLGSRLLDINPDLKLSSHQDFISKDNIPFYFPNEPEKNVYVIEAIDSVDSKCALINHLKRNKYPFIVSGGAGGKIEGSKIAIADLASVQQDPLIARLRQKLRIEYGFSDNHKFGIRCVFLNCNKQKPNQVNDAEEMKSLSEYFDDGKITFGTAMMATSAIGINLANEIIKRIISDVTV